jgi:hypothetical protein
MATRVRLEQIANLVFVIVALLVGAAAVRQLFSSPQPAPPPPTYQIGDAVPALLDRPYATTPRTVLLYLSTTCVPCTTSIPAFRRVIAEREARKTDFRVVASSRESEATLREYLVHNDLAVDDIAVVESLMWPKLSVTPTVLVIGSAGQVQFSWVGMLTNDAEKTLQRLLVGSENAHSSD